MKSTFFNILMALLVFELIKRQFLPQEKVSVVITMTQDETVELDDNIWGGV